MKVLSKINNPLISIFLLTSHLYSANGDNITVTVTKNGSFQKAGNMNAHTTEFVFTVAVSGADATTYASGYYQPKVIFSSGSAGTILNHSTLTQMNATPGTFTFEITDDNIEGSTGWPGDPGTVDFQVQFRDSDLGNSIDKDVVLAGGASSLDVDQDYPGLSYYEPSDNEYTKDASFRIYPDEATDSLVVIWTGDDASTQTEVITTSLNLNQWNYLDADNITLVEGVVYSNQVQIFDNAWNRSSTTRSNITCDLTAATLVGITSDETAGTYKIGDEIDFTVEFNEHVLPTGGTLVATFETGDTDNTANVSSRISGHWSDWSTHWGGTYTVTEGDEVTTLEVKSLAISAGNLYDRTSSVSTNLITPNSTTLPITDFGTANINDNVALELDGIRPTITSVTSSSVDASYSADETINITVNFSENVTLSTGNLLITLETGDTDNTLNVAAADIVSTQTAIGTYTVIAGDVSTDLAIKSISLTGGGTLTDAAGNALTSFAIATNLDAAHAIVLETTAPVIGTFTSTTADGTYGIGAVINVTVSFKNGTGGANEDVTLSAGSLDITLETGATDRTVSDAAISDDNTATFTYTVQEDDASSDLEVSAVAVTGGTISDAAGNELGASPAIPDGGNLDDASDIVIEATRPTITSMTSTTADGTYNIGDDVNITLQFSEAVTLAGGTLDVTFETGSTDQTLNIAAFTNSNSVSATYTVQAGDTTNRLAMSSIALATGAALKDVVGNSPNDLTNFTPAALLEAAHNIVIDGNAPTISKVSSTTADNSYGVGDEVNVTVYFSEVVTLAGGNLVVTLETGTTDQTVTISSISAAGSASATYTVQTGDESSDLAVKSIALSAGSITDANSNTMADFSVPASNDISDFKALVIDGTDPTAFTTGAVTTVASVSTFIVSGYWNENNTDVDITVPIDSDNSLVGGTVQVQAKVDANIYVNVGAAETIQSSDVTNGTLDVRIDKSASGNTDIEELTGFDNGGVITFNSIITDLAGNSTTGTASSTTLTIDTTAATVTGITSSTDNGIYNTGDIIAVDISFDDNITLTTGGTFGITMESGSVDNSISITSLTNSNSATANYTVQSGDSNADLYVKTLSITGGYLIDVAGNPMSGADLNTPTNMDTPKNIEIDGIDPTAFTVSSVTTTGGNVYAGYWNSTNTGVDIVVPIANDASLTDGNVQIRGKVGSEAYENIGSSETISADDLDGNKTISITAAQLEALTNFADDGIVTITAVITDEATNSTTGTESSTTLTIDETLPSTFTASTVSPDGNVENAGYYNGVNTGIEVNIPLESTDNTLTGGKIRLQAKAGANTWASVADFNTVLGTDLTAGFKTVTVDSGGTDSTDLDELTGFAENENLYFRAILWDVAGNQRTGSESATDIIIDQTRPTVSSVSSSSDNGSYKSGEFINIDVSSLEVLNVTDTPQITLETGDTDATVDYSSGTTTKTITFVYTVDDGHTSSDLDAKNVNALSLNSGTIYDDAGNELVLTLPTPGGSGSLGDNKDIIVDTDAPTASIAYTDELVKENDIVNITVTFDAAMASTPQIAIDYAGTDELDTTNMSQVNDTVWAYNNITIPDGNDGAATVSIIGTDIAENALTNTNTTNRSLMRVDNTHPTFTFLSPDNGNYVNSRNVGYKLSETSFSGTITWTRTGGIVDANSPHAITLAALELDEATTFSNYTLTSDPTTLVSGANYSITWSATDSAGNVSNDFISTPVFFDTTAPTSALTYSRYFASEDTVVTITATFNERTLPTPQIAIDYASVGDDIAATNMTIGADSTIWTYAATIPAGEANNGIVAISITGTDLASNSLRAVEVTFADTLVVDNSFPIVTFSYSNLTQPTVINKGKEGDLIEVTALFSEPANTNDAPVLNIDYVVDSLRSEAAFSTTNNDSTWVFQITLPAGTDDTGLMTASLVAKDRGGNPVTTYTNNNIFLVDNTLPVVTLTAPDSGAYVNHRNIGYRLSENVFSGTVTWTRLGGVDDASSPHVQTLDATELVGSSTFSDYTLVSDPTTLVSGTNYSIAWSVTDSVGNQSLAYSETPVHYDTTAPTSALTYSRYFASADTVVIITATFNERSLPTPQIVIDYTGDTDDVSATNMTVGADSTIWTYSATIPAGEANNGIANVSLIATDMALNTLRIADVTFSDTLEIDNTIPSITLSYINTTQTNLSNEGKYQDIIEISALFTEKAGTEQLPTLHIEYADSTNDSFVNMSSVSSSNNDSIWVYQVSLPDSLKNTGIMTVTMSAIDRAGNSVTIFNNNQDFEVDNTPPVDFSTGSVTPIGMNPVIGWLNGITDSIEIILPIPTPSSDPSLFLGGELGIQLYNKTRGVAWQTVGTTDSLTGSGNAIPFFRTYAEIMTALPPNVDLIQGDSLMVRAVLFDRIGNPTYGDSSINELVFDPFPTNLGQVTGGIFFTADTIISSDLVSANWSIFNDSIYQLIDGSGLARYDFKILHFDSTGTYVDNLINWTSLVLNEEFSVDTLGIQHQHQYSALIRAIDIAGNISDSVSTDTIRRINSAPIINTPLETIQSFEDIFFTQTIDFVDVDTSTILGDQFTYKLLTTHQFGHVPADTAVFLPGQNIINWTPTQSDTGLYTVRVIIDDNWNFSDTITYSLMMNAVNDTPTVAILTPYVDITMTEDQTEKVKFYLTHYGSDIDNDSTQLTWQAAVLDTSRKPGFPTTASLFFGRGTPDNVRRTLTEKYLSESNLYNNSNNILSVQQDKTNADIFQISKHNQSKLVAAQTYIDIAFTDTTGRWWAEVQVDSNYYGNSHKVIFFLSDLASASANDTSFLTITPENDSPMIDTIPRFEIIENQYGKIDLSEYISDVDDTTLTVRVSALTYKDNIAITSSSASATTVNDSLQYTITSYGDSVLFTPMIEWSDTSLIQVVVIDNQNARATRTFTVDIIRVPRPNLSLEVIQNNAFSNFFEIVITDTISKTDSLFVTLQGQRIALDTVASYTYVGHYSFDNPGTYSFYVKAWGVVGDTTITRSVNMALAKAFNDWSGSSPDGNFNVMGSSGSVQFDQSLLIVDSTMFNKYFYDRASYRLGNESSKFDLPVEVSFLSNSEHYAIYQRRNGVEWIELPSVSKYGKIMAFTDGMGYFRLGPKTIFVPGETSLHQNYPNPFNPVTNIIYDVGFNEGPQQRVKIIVYNLLGQHVRTLVNEYKDIGRYTVRWDGRDKNNVTVSSGLYFIRLINNTGRVNTKKMMLVR